MTVIERLATSLDRRDEAPNVDLAATIVQTADNDAIRELEWRDAASVCMIFGMHLPCLQLKKSIAALLPLSFFWMFAACVSICVRESTEGLGHNSVSLPTEMRDASDCHGCPLTPVPKAIIPERTVHASDLQTPVLIPLFMFPVDSLAGGFALESRQPLRSSIGLPLERLPALRI